MPDAGAVACEVRETSRRPLIVENSRRIYVEPLAISASPEGKLLIAGRHNYLFERTASGEWNAVAQDSIFGAVLPQRGPGKSLRSPVAMRLVDGIRAVAHENGTWAVVFAEAQTGGADQPRGRVARLWHGVVDGSGWRSLEPLPLPRAAVLEMSGASSLRRTGDTLTWALPIETPGAMPGVIVYERKGGQWYFEVVPTGYAQVDVAYSNRLGLLLAVRQADLEQQRDANSLFLWTRDPSWRVLRRVVPGTTEHVHKPSLGFGRADGVLSWEAEVRAPEGLLRREIHAMVGDIQRRNTTVATIDSSVVPMHPFYVLEASRGYRFWISDHIRTSSQQREIRVVQKLGDSIAVLSQFRNPFLGTFGATVTDRDDVLVAGGVRDDEREIITSLLIRFRVRCHAAAT
ncbi:MAG: hypothetical protein ICV87_08730 [Gemmatimonadetes bacterium]|nr:hypothetical protein [Gemmatimonadota bacterium]